jgi:protein O-mannosyl-transferase
MQKPETPGTPPASRIRVFPGALYLLSLLFFACGLMSKAMLVTWPFVMLLLDYWPLQRLPLFSFRPAVSTLARLALEKIPFFVLGGISCALTYFTEGGTRGTPSPILPRLEDAFVAYARYLGKTFWPARLTVLYTKPDHWSWLEVGGSVLVVVGMFAVVLWWGRQRPHLLVGWCWFWGTSIPVIGLTRGWGSFIADRFTYVPSMGILIFIIWGIWELTRGWQYQRLVLSVAGGMAIVSCLALTRRQIGYWRDSEALARHALELTGENWQAHYNLGHALDDKGQIDEAIRQYREAIRLKPNYPDAHNNLGIALDNKGQTGEAIQQFREAIRLKPDHLDAHYNLGNTLPKAGQMDEAIRQYREVIRLKPDYAAVYNNLGAALAKEGQIDEAIRHFEEFVRLRPRYADAHYNLAVALGRKGQADEAIRQFQEAIRLNPEYFDAYCSLGTAFCQLGRKDEAMGQFEEAVRLKPERADARNNLGTVLGMKGQIDEAIRQFQEALRLQPDYAEARKNLEFALATKAKASPSPGGATNR